MTHRAAAPAPATAHPATAHPRRAAVVLVALALLVSMLALLGARTPASAAVETRTVSLTAPARATVGTRIALSGVVRTRKATTPAGTAVSLQQRVGPGWRQVAVLRTARGGSFRAAVRPEAPGRLLYRAVAVARRVAGKRLPAAVSPGRAITVAPRRVAFTVFETVGEVTSTVAGDPLGFTGAVVGAPSTATVVLQRASGNRWLDVDSGEVGDDGSFTVVGRFTQPGVVRVRTVVSVDGVTTPSPTLTIDVVEDVAPDGVLRELITLPEHAAFVDVSTNQNIVTFATITPPDEDDDRSLTIHRRDIEEGTDTVVLGPVAYEELRSLDLSADGTTLAIVTRSTVPGFEGGTDPALYLYRAPSGALSRVAADVAEATLDATGTRVAYVVKEQGLRTGIRVDDVVAGTSRFLAEPNAVQLSVSAAGTRVAFTRNTVTPDDVSFAGGQIAVWDLAEEQPELAVTEITRSPSGQPGDDDSSTPLISPDGRFITFFSLAENLQAGVYGPALYRADADGGWPARIFAAGPGVFTMAAVPSNLGEVIETRHIGGSTIHDVEPREGRVTRVVGGTLSSPAFRGAAPWLRPSADGRFQPLLSPDGQKVLVLDRGPQPSAPGGGGS